MGDDGAPVDAHRRPGRRRQPWLIAALGTSLALGPTALGVRAAVAAFVDNSVVASSGFGAAPDWVAPQAGSTAVAKAVGYLAGAVRQGGDYYVYANVTDTGSPASGVAVGGESANVSAITPAGTAVPLVAGAYSVEGVTYNYRSAQLVAATPLAAGTYQYSITSTDGAGNTRTQTGYTVTVDNTAPTAANVQTTNAGVSGRAEAGDTIVFTFSERVDPQSILTGWNGAATNVVVRLVDGGCVLNVLVTVCSNDSVAVYDSANVAALPLGSVDLGRNDYHGGGLLGTATPVTFGASGTRSTMAQSGATVTVTLGTASATADTAAGTGAMVWTPSATAYDQAGNLSSTAATTEGGTADKDF